MKRSEMKARLVEAIHDYIWCNAADELADYLLDVIEKQGMQPPPYTFKHEVVNPTTVNTISVTNYEWEDEE